MQVWCQPDRSPRGREPGSATFWAPAPRQSTRPCPPSRPGSERAIVSVSPMWASFQTALRTCCHLRLEVEREAYRCCTRHYPDLAAMVQAESSEKGVQRRGQVPFIARHSFEYKRVRPTRGAGGLVRPIRHVNLFPDPAGAATVAGLTEEKSIPLDY